MHVDLRYDADTLEDPDDASNKIMSDIQVRVIVLLVATLDKSIHPSACVVPVVAITSPLMERCPPEYARGRISCSGVDADAKSNFCHQSMVLVVSNDVGQSDGSGNTEDAYCDARGSVSVAGTVMLVAPDQGVPAAATPPEVEPLARSRKLPAGRGEIKCRTRWREEEDDGKNIPPPITGVEDRGPSATASIVFQLEPLSVLYWYCKVSEDVVVNCPEPVDGSAASCTSMPS